MKEKLKNKAGPEEDEERGEGAPGEDGKAGIRGVEDREPVEAAKEKRKEDDDGEIDDGEIDVSMPSGAEPAAPPEEGDRRRVLGAVAVVTRER